MGHQTELNLLFNNVSPELCEKLSTGSLANFSIEEIIKLPVNLLYFLPVSNLSYTCVHQFFNKNMISDKQIRNIVR